MGPSSGWVSRGSTNLGEKEVNPYVAQSVCVEYVKQAGLKTPYKAYKRWKHRLTGDEEFLDFDMKTDKSPSLMAQSLDNSSDDIMERYVEGKGFVRLDEDNTPLRSWGVGKDKFEDTKGSRAVFRGWEGEKGKSFGESQTMTGASPSGWGSLRKGDWAILNVPSDQLDEAGRIAPMTYHVNIPRGDTSGWASQVADDVEGFAERIGRTVSEGDKRSRIERLAQQVVDDRSKVGRRNTALGATAAITGAGLLGVGAGALIKSRTRSNDG